MYATRTVIVWVVKGSLRRTDAKQLALFTQLKEQSENFCKMFFSNAIFSRKTAMSHARRSSRSRHHKPNRQTEG